TATSAVAAYFNGMIDRAKKPAVNRMRARHPIFLPLRRANAATLATVRLPSSNWPSSVAFAADGRRGLSQDCGADADGAVRPVPSGTACPPNLLRPDATDSTASQPDQLHPH